MRRGAAVCLLFMLLANALIVSGGGGADGAGSGAYGRGTSRATTLIHNVFELQNMSLDLNGSYELANDIDASATKNWNNGAGFTPVGNEFHSFNGTLDGKGHIITGLFINHSRWNYIGLFGRGGIDNLVKNVGVIDINVTGDRFVGGLVGYDSHGSVNNSYVTGNVTGMDDIGGLVGHAEPVTVNTSYYKGNVSGGSNVGGIVGYSIRCLVDNSHASGNMTGIGNVGGIVGGGFNNHIGNSYFTGSVNGSSQIGGFIGDDSVDSMSNSHYNIDDVSIYGGHHITAGGLYDAQYHDWISNDLMLDISDYSNVLVPSGGCYNINNIQGLRDLLGFADVAGYRFRLLSDIDLYNDSGFHIPYLAAVFDGGNHTISNMNLNMPFAHCLGMFGFNNGGTIINTGIVNDQIKGYGSVGGLVGINKGAVNNSFATGNVNGGDYTGGLVGYIDRDGTVNNSYAAGIANGYRNVGGLVGFNFGTVVNSHATGNVNGTSPVGGLAGETYGGGAIINSYATGNVNGWSKVGGLAGYSQYSPIISSFATGNVTGTEDYVGGLLGYNRITPVRNSYATGNVNGRGYVGGLLGYNNDSAVSNSYAAGNVNGSSNVGGLLGANTGNTVSNCFWDDETSGQKTSDGGSGRTTAQMKTMRTFTSAGWDFTNVWYMVEDITYPLLRWLLAIPLKANAGPDLSVYEGTLVTFNGSSSMGGFEIINYTWVFNDGMRNITLFGVAPSHTFNVPGVYSVILNITDALGRRDTDILTVTVKKVITPPIANAGPDQMGYQGTLVIFNGSGSTGSAGILKYTWTFNDGNGVITLNGAAPSHTFNIPGVYAVTLNATDAAGHWDMDEMTVTVIAKEDITPPVADAGPDQTVDEDTPVTFDGSASTDNAGIVNFSWEFIDGIPVTIYGVQPVYQFDNPGIFVVMLSVIDAAGNMGKDTMTITVNTVTVIDIIPPLAVAGHDQTVNQGTLVTFNGNGCSDNVGILNYTWKFMDEAPVAIYGVHPTYRFDHPGAFVVTLNVTDAAGNWKTDTLIVKVRDITSPVANAGPDQTVDEKMSVMFNGNGSSDNVGIVNYTWTFKYGAKRIVLSGVSPLFFFGVPGVYSIRLNVTDTVGFWTEDTMVVTVRDTTPPVADAGHDRTVPAGSSIAFNGSLSTDNVAISKFNWNFTYGGKARSLEGITVFFKFDKPGVYEVVLTVIDGAGNRGQDLVVVTVEPTVNVDYGNLAGLLWFPVLLIVMAIGAGYYIFMKRKRARPGKPGRSEIPQEPGPSGEMEEE
jgi:PKD repeat protein